MNLLTLLEILNYGLVLLYGLLLSVNIAGSEYTPRQKRLIALLCPLFLLFQTIVWLIGGVDAARHLYPLVIHLPLVLILRFVLKKGLLASIVCVCSAYLCCQLPRWGKLFAVMLSGSPLAGEISYTLLIFPIYFLLRRYFVRTAHDAMAYSPQSLLLFGSLPLVYYVFDYATVVYSDALYTGAPALLEAFPTVLILFYVAFLTAYHRQVQTRMQSEFQNSMLELQLKQSGLELETMRQMESQTAIYRHDMRHHMAMIESYLSAEHIQQAKDYIQSVQTLITSVNPKRFCENELVNLLCASFSSKAEQERIQLKITATLPAVLPIADTALCSLLSNGLENALQAASRMDASHRWVTLYCAVRSNNLLIEIQNPYTGDIRLKDGLPVSDRPGHGFGCHSIRTIIEHSHGQFSFDPTDGTFTLRLILPLRGPSGAQ